MSAKGEKISREQSSIYRHAGEHFCLVGPLSSMANPLITKGAAQAKTLPFLSFPGEVFSETFLAILRFVDDGGNPLVPAGIMDSDSKVEVVFDETTNLRLSTSGKDGSDKGYGTNSLLEQWRDSYPDNDDYDPYDDDMYENHDMSEHLQSICDDFDITASDARIATPTSQLDLPELQYGIISGFG
ncbi:hypothetical protein Tco_0891478, partial [Tanacetum coccineum]